MRTALGLRPRSAWAQVVPTRSLDRPPVREGGESWGASGQGEVIDSSQRRVEARREYLERRGRSSGGGGLHGALGERRLAGSDLARRVGETYEAVGPGPVFERWGA